MENFSTHWGALPRRFPLPFPLQTLGYIARKKQWVRTTFSTCNFSFLLAGGGRYVRRGLARAVQAPCVITQWPGDRVEYGPEGKFSSWEELYFIFRPEARAPLEACRYIQDEYPCWSLPENGEWQDVVAQILRLGASPKVEIADRMDRLCDRLMLESFPADVPRQGEPAGREAIRAIQAALLRAPARSPDFPALARARGLSHSTFRREWARLVGPPPARYLAEQRMREACRLLVETSRPIGRIAAAVGFDDALYFSRKFRKHTGVPPSEYRSRYRAGIDRSES